MAERMGKLPTTPVRYAHVAPDGTIPYFEASDGRQVGGRLPAGSNPKALVDRGYTFLDREAFLQAQAATNPEYRADQAEVDDLAEAFDVSMGAAPDTQTGEAMNGQGGDMLSPEMMEILQQYANEGRLGELFQPFQQEQSVLNQEMEIAQSLGQRRAPQRSSPTGALFSGLANAAGGIGGAMLQKKGLEGQAALGQRMQGDASGRVGAILRAAMQRKGMDPNTGLMTPAVDDATLASLFSGG